MTMADTYTNSARLPSSREHKSFKGYSSAQGSQSDLNSRQATSMAGYDAEAAEWKVETRGQRTGGMLRKGSSLGRNDLGVLRRYQEKKMAEARERSTANRGRPAKLNSVDQKINLTITAQPDISNTPLHGKDKIGGISTFFLTVTCRVLFILLVLAIVWIPGILSFTIFPNSALWGVGLLWWSIWLSVVWGGWWLALGASYVSRCIVGGIAVSSRQDTDPRHRYSAIFFWSLAVWISYKPFIKARQAKSTNEESAQVVTTLGGLLFGGLICSGILLVEKFFIHRIRCTFQEQSHTKRIADLEVAVGTLVVLFKNSADIVLRPDLPLSEVIFESNLTHKHKPKQGNWVGMELHNHGNIAGDLFLESRPPKMIVKTALGSANKSRLLARRLFYSFSRPGADYVVLEDIESLFPTHNDAAAAFACFDRDGNGNVFREEFETACLHFHREQVAMENSIRDMDASVARLDDMLMSLYGVVCAVIFAVVVDTQFTGLLIGVGILILGLTWLFGGSLQEVLTSAIFLFVKHPFDVGDKVIIKDEILTVKEMTLLSTIFLDSNSTSLQVSNNQLNGLFIYNIRRSPQISETFVFDVHYSTSIEAIEKLRETMLEYVRREKRDFHPVFDVTIKDFPGQMKMTLSADIKYKSNTLHTGLKVKRRNKWICALKATLAELKIFGPTGNPDVPSIKRYTNVPWDIAEKQDLAAQKYA